ncbi:hypothetical protein IQ260_08195 [Leptolyngbya cf. ectocarpi LEGE 11479]|uniref:Magnetosome protein MamS/MamX domain-containing protein n=1 Tax=Leptolyngbya cf. ectocarpi LEGE 11479 TaxID=1828722 RepID=A0A928X1B9_LEPEC|nr:hypothetical protein [Leptolyngbya ectocarpi]MBE9066632.1 hypothetical protein [Leptolyngbya cf. ectocarpi LEGE 11479]
MKRYITYMTLAALAGAGLTYLALTMTPLRAQVINRPMFRANNPDSAWVIPRYRHHGRRGPSRHSYGPDFFPMYNGVYDPSALETMSGQVMAIEQVGAAGQGTWLEVKTDQETVSVHLGPAWYLEDQKVAISPNDAIEITGIRNTWNNSITIIASKIKLDERTVELRDADGYPLWMNWRQSIHPNN